MTTCLTTYGKTAKNSIFFTLRGVAQLVARDVWDVDAAGSNPVTPTKNQICRWFGSLIFQYIYSLESIMYQPKELTSITDTRLVGYWNNEKTPVYEVSSSHGFNQIIGYVKHTNAEYGTVLYRGQANLHEKLIPSILHGFPNDAELKDRESLLKNHIENILNDSKMNTLLHFDETTQGRSFYKQYVIESMLQHYGFRTRFQDFVDNHWTALWFGLYELQKEKMKGSRKDQEFYNYYYTRRSPIYPIKKEKPSCLTLKEPSLLELPSKPALFDIVSPDDYTPDMIGDQKNAHQILNLKESKTREKALRKLIEKDISEKERKNRQKIEKWEKEVKKIKAINDHSLEQYKIDQESDIAYVYILLYVADTKGENFKGVYTGTETITIDLRKSLPSVLLRPCAQHGWTVKRMGNDSDLSEGVVCVLRLTVDLVSEMMGEGLLVKPENFFPPIEYDNGYKILLGRETPAPFGSPAAKNPRDLPSLFPFGSLQHFVIK